MSPSNSRASQREYREYVERWVHEIKAPLTAARLICRELDGGTRRKLIVELSQIEAHVERALFYARAENPEQDCLFRQIELEKIAAQAIENHRSLLIQNDIRVEMENMNCAVYTDEKWAVFILGQLLQNAARYRGAEPVITLFARPLGRRTRLIVHDNGIGIPDGELSNVFKRFYRVDKARSRAAGGTGLGLSIVNDTVSRRGGAIRAESLPKGGTRFTVTLPSAAEKEERA